jgi:predicted membrane protein
MDRMFDILIYVALASVAITLAFGIYSLYRGGEFGRSYSNKLMRLRVVLQFVAIIILVAAFYWRHRGG